MKKQPCEPQVGADIEVFLATDTEGIIPCVGIVPGTKDDPYTPDGWSKGYAMQEDNVMLEYNIPPVKDGDDMEQAISNARDMIREELDVKYTYVVHPEHEFLPEQLEHPQAKVIGCEPDFDAYEGGQQRVVQHALTNTRSCGGHIHLGGNFNCPDFVAALFADLWLGVLCRLYPYNANDRTKWYGKPGIFRPKPYGIEWRTPDNQWTTNFEDRWSVGDRGTALCKFLTENDAEVIRKVFTGITWTRVRDIMLPEVRKDMHDVNHVIETIKREARTAGLPI